MNQPLPLVYMSYPGRPETNAVIKFGDRTAIIKLNRQFSPNLIVKSDLYVQPLPHQCLTYWFLFGSARPGHDV